MLEIGSLVDGKYKILNKVGQGGMSVVYLAMNEKANKQWAVKEVRKDGVKDFEIVKQGLVAETDILKKLSHPNLPSIVDVIDTNDSFIIIMDYIQGNSLNKALDEYGAQPQEHVIAWAKQLCDVLGYLHTRNPAIIYRDMKPANVMLKPDGNVTLIDFGTAREFKEKNLADTTCLGTVGYAAPEQFGGMGQTDARTDIYCLGATLYHLVTGMNPCEPPYEIKPIREINPALSSGLERIIQKCTQRDPNDRYQSAAELMYALEHYEEIDDLYKKKQKRKLYKFIACVALTLVFAGTSVWGYLAAENKKRENYDYILANADSPEDYYEAIVTDPTRVEAYLGDGDNKGLINFLIDDDKLTGDDSAVFTKLKGGLDQKNMMGYSSTVKVLEELKESNPKGYEDVCYQIGEACMFFSSVAVKDDKYITAATWFQHAGDRYPVAKIYCDIASCLQNIQKFKNAEQFVNLYKEYETLWNKVQTLQKDALKYDIDLKLRVWKETVSMIRNNVEYFCEVSSKSEITTLLEDIKTNCSLMTGIGLKDSVSSIIESVETTKSKIETVKTEKAEG